jgi:asparagine synthase (glutamine-hydrolysing)
MLTWDGRLDNRDQLILELEDHVKTELKTDVAIVMAAYLRWGLDFLPRLIGDFAFSLWEPRTRTLALSRDAFGVRSLFYHMNAQQIVWSSILKELLAATDATLEVDDEYIAGFLTRYSEPWQTPYKCFGAVPPGAVVIVGEGLLKTATYWKPNTHATLNYRTAREYEDHFRHELRDAVRCRLRASGPVFSELSGGLDSSSVVCVGDELVARGDAAATSLETVSYVYNEARSSDERSFINSVEEKRGTPGHHLLEDEFRLLTASAEEEFFSAPSYHYYYFERFRALRELMAKHDARVLLSGEGGDQLNFSNPDPDIIVADRIASHQFLSLHRLLRHWSSAVNKPYLQMFWSGMVLLLPRFAQIRCRSIAQSPTWLDVDFRRRMNIDDRMLGPSDVYGYKLPSQRDQVEGLLSVVRTVSAIYFQEYARVEITFPYLHRPFVEFMLAVPVEQKIRPNEGRWLLRRSLRELLPEKVAQRKGKKGPTAALSMAVAREWPRLKTMFDDPRVCAYGYVNRARLLSAIDRVRHGAEKFSFQLFATIALELWLRSLERRSSKVSGNAGVEGEMFRTNAVRAASTFTITL